MRKPFIITLLGEEKEEGGEGGEEEEGEEEGGEEGEGCQLPPELLCLRL